MTYPTPAPGVARPPAERNHSTTFLVLGFVLIAVCGLVVTPLVLLSTGPGAFAIGVLFALVPVAPLLAYFAWVDRNEPEPKALLVFAFGWGAAVATLGALILNGISVVALDAAGQNPDIVSVAVVAPIVEEAFKGIGIIAIILVGRRALDGVVDGIVYAGMVGVGFAFVENILYLGSALTESGGGGLVGTFVLRGIVSPFAHPLFTAALGIAIAYASRRGGASWLWVPVGYLISVALHAFWNGTAVLAPDSFIVLFVLVQIPVFACYIGLAIWARRREARLIATHLSPYADAGWVTPQELSMMASLGTRRAALAAARGAGPVAAAAMHRYQRAAVQLAFLRNRIVRGSAPPDAQVRQHDLLESLVRDRPTGALPRA